MRFGDNARFLLLTLGVFCLTLGAAVLLFSLIERVFFAASYVGQLLLLAPVTIVLGLLLLLCSRRRPL